MVSVDGYFKRLLYIESTVVHVVIGVPGIANEDSYSIGFSTKGVPVVFSRFGWVDDFFQCEGKNTLYLVSLASFAKVSHEAWRLFVFLASVFTTVRSLEVYSPSFSLGGNIRVNSYREGQL